MDMRCTIDSLTGTTGSGGTVTSFGGGCGRAAGPDAWREVSAQATRAAAPSRRPLALQLCRASHSPRQAHRVRERGDVTAKRLKAETGGAATPTPGAHGNHHATHQATATATVTRATEMDTRATEKEDDHHGTTTTDEAPH